MSLSIWKWQLDLLDFKKIRLEKEIEEIRFIFKSIEVQCNEDLKNRVEKLLKIMNEELDRINKEIEIALSRVHTIKTSNVEGLLRHVLNQQRRKDALEKHARMVYDSDKDVEGEFSDE